MDASPDLKPTDLKIAPSRRPRRNKLQSAVAYLRRNPSLATGILLLLSLLMFAAIGAIVYGTANSRALSVPAGLAPSGRYPFGTDMQGRDLMATMIAGTPLTLRIGLIAGLVGVLAGSVLGFVAAYYGGVVDTIIRGIVDVGLTVPSLLVLIIIAVSVKGTLSVDQMALVVASLAWLRPTRTIRSQVLTLRERGYVKLATLSGMRGPEIIAKEMVPNLLPYLGAQLVVAVAAAVLASIGLEALGLGPMDSPTLGMTIYWVIANAAILLGMWWWFIPPIIIIIILFLGLFNLSSGLDEIANPRLRRSA